MRKNRRPAGHRVLRKASEIRYTGSRLVGGTLPPPGLSGPEKLKSRSDKLCIHTLDASIPVNLDCPYRPQLRQRSKGNTGTGALPDRQLGKARMATSQARQMEQQSKTG